MNILQVISSGGFYGAERMLLELSRFMRSEGHRVWLGTICPPDDDPPQVADEARAEGLPVFPIPSLSRFDGRTMDAIRQAVDRLDIHLVHCHGYKADIFAGLARPGARLVSTCHNWLTESVKLMLFELLDKAVLHHFDGVVAVSAAIDDQLAAAGVPQERRQIIENGISLPDAASGVPREQVRRALGVPGDAPLVLAVGRFDRFKAFHLLLEAMARLGGAAGPASAARLVLVGDGGLRQELLARCQQLGLGERVLFAGYRRDIPDLLRAADLFVISSIDEGLPMALLEALAAGLPVVSTRVGAVPEALGEGEFGALVPVGDAGALARAMVELLSNPERRAALAAAGHGRYRRRFSREAMGRRYLELYQRVSRGGEPRQPGEGS